MGLVIGGLVVILLLSNSLSFDSGRIILGFGPVAFGLLGEYRYFALRSAHMPSTGIAMGLLFLAVAVLVLLARFGVDDVQTYLKTVAILLTVCGLGLIGCAFMLKRRPGKTVARSASPPEPASSAGADRSSSTEPRGLNAYPTAAENTSAAAVVLERFSQRPS